MHDGRVRQNARAFRVKWHEKQWSAYLFFDFLYAMKDSL